MSMTAACKLMHLVEAFSTPWFLLANKTNHNLVFFLLEMLNNLIQYQFDGNSNLAYTMIRKQISQGIIKEAQNKSDLSTTYYHAMNKLIKRQAWPFQSTKNIIKTLRGPSP